MLAVVESMTCERCGFPLPADAKFCPNCGAPVAAVIADERKIVTVLFADLVGSSKLAARLDPERFREVIQAFFRMASSELSSLRGRAEKFIGDAVMAVFGVPHAHEDDALRAVRAALMIRERTARLGEELNLPVPLQVRIGVNSGSVATGSGLEDQLLVTGAAVNLASRLQEAAEPGEILAGETTRQLTERAVAFGAPRQIVAAGFEGEVKAWPVEALSPRSVRQTIPLVGRRRELALLTEAFERAREAGRAHLVTVLGEPGIGKSRLVDEFMAGLPDEVKILYGRTSEFDEDPTFSPLGEMIRGELGVSREAPQDEVRKRLVEAAAAILHPSEAERVAARLGLAVGVEEQSWDTVVERLKDHVEEEEGRRERRRYRAGEIRAGFVAYLEGAARLGPVVLVFEDAHLAEPELFDLVEEVLREARRIPLLVVFAGRDELLEKRPGWGGGVPDAVTLRLEPLTEREAVELALAAGESLDEETAARVATQAGGNPFFIVETTGMLRQEHPEHRLGVLHSHLLPATVQAVVASRIDHLPERAKELVRRASVFARSTFAVAELSLIADPDEETLELLEEEEWFVHDRDRPDVWRFRHEMLRDVAYESLPKRERKRLHLEVAEGLEREEPGRWPQAIAYHLEQAAKASLDLDPRDRTLADRAVTALARVADRARWRLESRTAIELYERALALVDPDASWGVREARILAGIGEARYWLGEFDGAEQTLSRALEVGGDDAWVRTRAARFLGDIALNYRGDVERASHLFDRALAAARELNDPWATAPTLLMAGWAPFWRGDLEAARKMFEEALAIARSNPDGDPLGEARALTALTSVISPVGDEAECLALGQRALVIGRETNDQFTVAVAQENVGNSLRRMWRLDEALLALEESVRIFRELGARWELASALGDRGTVHRLAGRLDRAEADYREALDLCRKLGERSLIAWTAGRLVMVLLARGKRDEAIRLLEEPEAHLKAGGLESRTSLLWAELYVALYEGDWETARERGLQILEIEREQGWPNPVATQVWWVGKVFGPDAVGGEEVLEEARRTLEKAHWVQSIMDPELALSLIPKA
jgi:class 3 adenylate cyclase/tetratricopeptide (TPR) repeat protein